MEWAHLLSKSALPLYPPPPNPNPNLTTIPPTATSEDSTLSLNLWFCQLLLYRTAARLQPDNERLIPEICGTARLIITQFLQIRFTTAPALIDHVYFIVGYAALTLCDYTLSDPLISQVRGFLLHLAPSGDNLSYRIACIVGEVQRRYSETTTVVTAGSHSSSSPVADVKGVQMFSPSQHHRSGMDISQLMSSAEGLDSLVEGYNCLEQMMPGYAASQPAFEAPDLFHSPTTGTTGGAMPIGLVPRALHDW